MSAGQGLWWIAPDRLLAGKRPGITGGEKDQLIADLESIAAHRSNASDPATFDPHATESAAKRLIKHYRKSGRNDDAKRLHEIVARALEHLDKQT